MSELRISIENEASVEDRRKVTDGIRAYNARFAPQIAEETLTLLLRDADGEVRGGLLAEMYWGWLFSSPSSGWKSRCGGRDTARA